MDQKGYVMSGLAFLLILPAILLVAVFVDMTTIGGESVGLVMQSDTTFYAAKDIERNIPVIGAQVLKEAANNAISNGTTCSSSDIKDRLEARMNVTANKTKEYIGADDVKCKIVSVNPSSNPFLIEINSTIYVKKGTSVHNDTLSQDISIKGLPDPLPFIILKNYGTITLDNTNGTINYGSSLKNYLMNKGFNNSTASLYENATSGGIILQCNFEPYSSPKDGHGANVTSTEIQNLLSCLGTGNYHESSDGACYLCRLEGKSTCSHYGIETFIVPKPVVEDSSTNFAPVSIDHVLFGDSPYLGKALIYLESGHNPTTYYKLYLEKNGHLEKYGLPVTY